MLQTMRSNLKGSIAFLIIGILIIPLALVGVEQFGSGGYSRDVATVNGDKIGEQQFNSAFSAQLQANPQANQEVLREQVLDQMILSSLLKKSAEDGDMTVSDQKLSALLSERYRNNPQGYEREIRALGLTSNSFNEHMKGTAAANQLQTALVSSHFVMASELENIIAIRQQKRDFTWIRLPIAPEIAKVNLTEEEITTHYEANKAGFLSEASARFEYIDINTASFTDSVEVKDSEVNAQYQIGLDEAANNQQKTIAHIFVEKSNEGAAEKIKTLQESLTADNFNDLVQQYSDDLFSKEEKGVLGVYPQDGLEEFEAGFADLSEGQVSKTAFESDSGSHFFKVISVGASSDSAPSLKQVKQRLLTEARLAAFDTAVENLRANAYNADTLEQFADENNLTAHKTELVTRSTMPGPLADPTIVAAAFSQKVTEDNDVSDLVQLQDRAIMVKKIDYLPPKTLSLEEKKDDIVAALKKEKAQLLLEEKSTQLVSQFDTGAVDPEVTYNSEKAIGRFNPAIDKEIVGKVFSMAKPTESEPTTTTALLDNGDMLIAKLSKVENGKISDIEKEEKEGLESFLQNTYATGEIVAWVTELKSKAEVDIRPTTQY